MGGEGGRRRDQKFRVGEKGEGKTKTENDRDKMASAGLTVKYSWAFEDKRMS